MNKKIFAALASATMALSATGSLAVFAQDFEDEAQVLPSQPGETTEVVWNEENFGDLTKLTSDTVTNQATKATSIVIADTNNINGKLELGKTYTVKDLEAITNITITNNDNDLTDLKTIKGLKYLTKLVTFNNSASTATLTNTTVDFSANSELTTVNLKGADTYNVGTTDAVLPNVTEVLLPVSPEDDFGKLTELTLTNTAIKSLDLTEQDNLSTVTISNENGADDFANGGLNTLNVSQNTKLGTLSVTGTGLSNLQLPTAKNSSITTLTLNDNNLSEIDLSGQKADLTALNLENNALNTLDIKKFANLASLNIAGNHIGALDTTGCTALTDANTVILGPQVFYVAEDAGSVNLVDEIPGLKASLVGAPNDADGKSLFDDETGELTLDGNGQSYVYKVANPGAFDKAKPLTVVIAKANPMHRLYNPNSGEHFYTKDLNENDTLVELGWKSEGIGWVAPIDKAAGNRPVYRLYNPNAGDHHYTMNENEKNVLTSIGWKYEGIGWYSYDNANGTAGGLASIKSPAGIFDVEPKNAVVLREYNPNAKAAGAHNYTLNQAENDFLVSVGWLDEGTAWNAIK